MTTNEATLDFTIEARQMFYTDGGRSAGFAVFCCMDGFARHAALPFYAGEHHSINHRLFDSGEKALAAYNNATELKKAAYPGQRKA